MKKKHCRITFLCLLFAITVCFTGCKSSAKKEDTNVDKGNQNITSTDATNENITNENTTDENSTNENTTDENMTNENTNNENTTNNDVTNNNGSSSGNSSQTSKPDNKPETPPTQAPTTPPTQALTTPPTQAPTQAPAQSGYSKDYAQSVLDLVNMERHKEGLSDLQLEYTLMSAAQLRAQECSVLFSHTRPDGSKCFTAWNVSYSYAGENIAAGYTTAAEVVQGWMDSEGHRANILNPNYTHLAVGCWYAPGSEYGYYWAQCFIGR